MKVNAQLVSFERIALEAAVREHPGDTVAAYALRDWLMEHDYTPLGARRVVARCVREGTEQRQADEVRHRIASDPDYSHAMRGFIRALSPYRASFGFRMVIVPGGSKPRTLESKEVWVDARGNEHDLIQESTEYHSDVHPVPVITCVEIGAAWAAHAMGAEQLGRAAQVRRRATRRA